MAVDEQRGAGKQARIHAHTFASVHFNYHKAFPLFAIAFNFGFQLFEECFLEFQNFFHVHTSEQGFGGGDGSIGEKDILKLVVAGGQDGSALVHFGGVEEIEHGQMLNGEDAVHAFETEAALAIEEVGDVGLLEAGLLGQTEAGEIAFVDTLPKSIAEIVLQDSEFHARSIAWIIAMRYFKNDFHSSMGITTLTAEIRSYTLPAVYNSTYFKGSERAMSGPDNSNEGKNFIEFRRKVRASEALSASMESLLKTLNFNGRISVVVQNGRVLKSGYEEGFFRQREAGSLLAGGTPAEL